jgi:hypothetical protein
MIYRELLLGCGYRRQRLVDPYRYPALHSATIAAEEERWQRPVTVDGNLDCKPDFLMDLDIQPWFTHQPQDEHELELLQRLDRGRWCFRDNLFHEVHAYEVLEHLGRQGDPHSFFAHFDELWRILQPGGFVCATVPSRFSPWLWADPGHRRAILPASLVFLCRPHYDQYIATTPSSDYRALFMSDFDILYSRDDEETHTFVLQAVKPARAPAGASR